MPYFTFHEVGVVKIALVKTLRYERQFDVESEPRIDSMSPAEFAKARHAKTTVDRAVAQLEKALRDETRTVKQSAVWEERLQAYKTNRQSIIEDMRRQLAACNTAVDHFPLGTMLWYAPEGEWRVMHKGPLVEITAYNTDSQYGSLQYKNGYYPGVTRTDSFFDSFEAALAWRAKTFATALPGTLDPKQVTVEDTYLYRPEWSYGH